VRRDRVFGGGSAKLSFFDKWGNAASVIGLGISVVGFVATLLSIWLVKERVRKILARTSGQLLAVDIVILMRLVTDIRDAGRDRRWERAIDRGQQARHIAIAIRHNPQLLLEEKNGLDGTAEDLRQVIQYIENNRLDEGDETENLPDEKKRTLDRMVVILGNIQGRLQRSALEV
jgi:hypothetical protein